MRWGLVRSTPSSSIVGLRAVVPVRHLGDFLAQLGLAEVHPAAPAREHVVDAVLAEQLRELGEPVAVGVDLRLHVAPGHLRRAGIGADQRLHVGVDLAAAQDLERRDQQALLKEIGGVAAVGAGDLAAEVRLVRDVADEADEPLGGEHPARSGRRRSRGSGGLVGMVDDEGVARRDVVPNQRRISFTCAASGPICSGCGMPCATMRPSPSKIAKVKSWLSLMMVE